MYYKRKNIKKSCNNNKFKKSAHTKSWKFDLPNRLNSLSNIQKILDYIMKKHEKLPDNPPIRIYVNKRENRIKRLYYLKLLTPEMMKLPGSTKSKITNWKMMRICLI